MAPLQITALNILIRIGRNAQGIRLLVITGLRLPLRLLRVSLLDS